MSLVEQQYWDDAYASLDLVYDPSGLPFRDLFDRFLPNGGSCFEVGCYPGSFLMYLCRRFGYIANGIDLTPNVESILPAFLASNHIQYDKLFRGDFLTFIGDVQYDVVCSFGFIEHFREYEQVIEKQIALVKPGGYMIMSTPNFTGLYKVLHAVYDGENLKRHNTRAMSVHRWRSILKKHGFNILYNGYYGSAEMWSDEIMHGSKAKSFQLISSAWRKIGKIVKVPTSLFSPYIVSISQKPL